jgi:hypothetical protein
MTGSRGSSVDRVLVALDPAAPMAATLDALAGLVSDAQPEVKGLFIEDASLLALSSLSFVREVALDTASEQRMTAELLERQMKAQRIRVERMLADASRRLSLRPSFKVARGIVLEELLREAEQADLILLGRSHRVAGPRSWMGIRLGGLAEKIAGTLAIVQDAWSTGRSVSLVYDGSEAATRCLGLARQIGAREGLSLVVALVGDAEDRAHWQKRVGAVAPGIAEWHSLAAPVLSDLVAIARNAQSRVIVLPGHLERQCSNLIEGLLRDLDCSVVIVGELRSGGNANPANQELLTDDAR